MYIILYVYYTHIYFLKQNVRDNIKVVYNTALPVIFGVKKYADALWDVCKKRNITVNVQTNLVKINPATEEAVFQKLDGSNETFVEKVCFIICKMHISIINRQVITHNIFLLSFHYFMYVHQWVRLMF